MARLRAAMRHRVQQQGGRPVFHDGDLSVDLVRRTVTARGQEIKLSPRNTIYFNSLCFMQEGF